MSFTKRSFAQLALGALLATSSVVHGATTLLNVSYDPTRELYEEYNKEFAKHWKAKTSSRTADRASKRVPSSMDCKPTS
jgi:sulfate transport system substrate-binding protein